MAAMNLPFAHSPSHPHASLPEAVEPPALARKLGYAGLIPFVLCMSLIWLVHPELQPWVALALSAYAATIVSFLGGVHWGLAMRAGLAGPRSFAWAVVPSLGAWLAMVMPAYAGLVVLGGLLIACYLVDRRLFLAQGLSVWLTMRFRLSMVAALCCFLGAAGS
jgi:hypothetical protein